MDLSPFCPIVESCGEGAYYPVNGQVQSDPINPNPLIIRGGAVDRVFFQSDERHTDRREEDFSFSMGRDAEVTS